MLSDDRLERFARHIVLPEIGGAGQTRLGQSHVALIGAGGIGCPALQYLAGAGIGTISIIDDDRVDASNLQRQTLFRPADIGGAKADIAALWTRRFDPDLQVIPHVARIGAANAERLLAGVDVIVDGSDNFATRLAVSDMATQLHIPLVSAALGRFQGQIGSFRGWRSDEPCYRCFVGDAFDAEDCDSCSDQGVLGAMAGIMGSMAAMEAVRLLTGFGEDQAGRLHLFDGLKPGMRTIRLVKDPACKGCVHAGKDGAVTA